MKNLLLGYFNVLFFYSSSYIDGSAAYLTLQNANRFSKLAIDVATKKHIFSLIILCCESHRYWIHKKSKVLLSQKRMKNSPDSIFSLLHTVFIDSIIINFSWIHSNGDFLVLETHYIFKTHQITACVLTAGCRPITHSLILFDSVNVSWRNCVAIRQSSLSASQRFSVWASWSCLLLIWGLEWNVLDFMDKRLLWDPPVGQYPDRPWIQKQWFILI